MKMYFYSFNRRRRKTEQAKNNKNKLKGRTVIRCATNELFFALQPMTKYTKYIIILKEGAAVEEYVKDIGIFTFQGYVFPREIGQYK